MLINEFYTSLIDGIVIGLESFFFLAYAALLNFWTSRKVTLQYLYMQASAAITSLSETSSESGDEKLESVDKNVIEFVKIEKFFITGVLDELRICFSSNHSVSFELLFKYYFA